ncbi:dnaJ homolog subfamily C member 30, mitochondrial-like [Musca autumnalis]|uniref:dnaJ homolog subfamily C member 30, mitochondrial-like n=1 Tax=Musca autumnalis TaxID=221902 RepID=UPI003CF231C0
MSTTKILCPRFLRNILLVKYTRNISTGSVNYSTHYDVLGISPKATQGEVKAAYYKLSMQYHPDKNQGSETAALKFREITQAYEILGNFRLRKLYDKGILHTAGPQYAQRANEAPEPDDATTRFYKSRFRKSKVADSKGRTQMYDFDEWTRQHYGDSFERRRTAKEKYDYNKEREKDDLLIMQKEIVLLCIAIFSVLAYWKVYSESSYDLPKERATRMAEGKTKNEKDSTI